MRYSISNGGYGSLYSFCGQACTWAHHCDKQLCSIRLFAYGNGKDAFVSVYWYFRNDT
ncbi:MAG TPA: hypothetical protein OIL92_01495 [Oscillospiraceae bacterium]|nr:hypothetical protein [Oscillospiraceae bacterium]